jgi:hypothetical protein
MLLIKKYYLIRLSNPRLSLSSIFTYPFRGYTFLLKNPRLPWTPLGVPYFTAGCSIFTRNPQICRSLISSRLSVWDNNISRFYLTVVSSISTYPFRGYTFLLKNPRLPWTPLGVPYFTTGCSIFTRNPQWCCSLISSRLSVWDNNISRFYLTVVSSISTYPFRGYTFLLKSPRLPWTPLGVPYFNAGCWIFTWNPQIFRSLIPSRLFVGHSYVTRVSLTAVSTIATYPFRGNTFLIISPRLDWTPLGVPYWRKLY